MASTSRASSGPRPAPSSGRTTSVPAVASSFRRAGLKRPSMNRAGSSHRRSASAARAAPASRASGWALRGRRVLHPDHADDRLLVHHGDGEGQPDDHEGRVQYGRQPEDDHERPPVAEQVADLAAGDQADDGAAHGGSLGARRRCFWSVGLRAGRAGARSGSEGGGERARRPAALAAASGSGRMQQSFLVPAHASGGGTPSLIVDVLDGFAKVTVVPDLLDIALFREPLPGPVLAG